MRDEAAIKREICKLFRLKESALLAGDYAKANFYLREIKRRECLLGDPPDGSWAAYQRYLLDT